MLRASPSVSCRVGHLGVTSLCTCQYLCLSIANGLQIGLSRCTGERKEQEVPGGQAA